jgi:hypothetical protein
MRVKITLMRVKITFVYVKITIVRFKITLIHVEITLCVSKSHANVSIYHVCVSIFLHVSIWLAIYHRVILDIFMQRYNNVITKMYSSLLKNYICRNKIWKWKMYIISGAWKSEAVLCIRKTFFLCSITLLLFSITNSCHSNSIKIIALHWIQSFWKQCYCPTRRHLRI